MDPDAAAVAGIDEHAVLVARDGALAGAERGRIVCGHAAARLHVSGERIPDRRERAVDDVLAIAPQFRIH
ncbi:MAG TPA: hypothetical protein VEY92_11765 [Pseudoxanthomonas sp.]|nr:hypothetical protein [Pseudoxanthomonas sp.]